MRTFELLIAKYNTEFGDSIKFPLFFQKAHFKFPHVCESQQLPDNNGIYSSSDDNSNDGTIEVYLQFVTCKLFFVCFFSLLFSNSFHRLIYF